jgi:hypothetical protein
MALPLIRPSEASIRINCPGSIHLSKTVPPKQDTEFTIEGTLAHEWATKALLSPKDLEKCENKEMRFHVENYANFINKVRQKVGGFDNEWVEQKVRYNQYLIGTADFAAVYAGGTRLFFADLKYGQGVGVLAEENFQLIAYLLCVISHHKLTKVDRATLCIYQPRARDGEGNIRHWTIFAQDIEEWREVFDKGISECLAISEGRLNPYYHAGSHCFWCVAKPVCKEFVDHIKKESLGLISPIEDSKLPVLKDPATLSVKQISRLLAIESRVKEMYKALKPFAEHLLMSRTVTEEELGFKLVEGRSNRKWIEDTKRVENTLVSLGAKKVYKDPVLIGIGEAEEQVGKNKISAITIKPPGKPTMVPLEDKRPAIIFENNADLLTSLEDTEEYTEE